MGEISTINNLELNDTDKYTDFCMKYAAKYPYHDTELRNADFHSNFDDLSGDDLTHLPNYFNINKKHEGSVYNN